MQVQYVIVLLAFVAVVVADDDDSMEKGLRVPRYPAEVSRRMEPLQYKIDEICTYTYTVFGAMEGKIASRRRNWENNISNDLKSLKASLRSKENKELQKAKKEGKAEDEYAIEFCVREEQASYQNDLTARLNETLGCFDEFTKKANDMADDARRTFNLKSFTTRTYAEDMRKEWIACSRPRVDRECIERCIIEQMERFEITRDVSRTTVEKSRKADSYHHYAIDFCVRIHKSYLNERQGKYDKYLHECILYP